MVLSLVGEVRKKHFHPDSETYTGCDTIATFLEAGWSLPLVVKVEAHSRSGRIITVYRFTFSKRGQSCTLKVIANPVVERIVNRMKLDQF